MGTRPILGMGTRPILEKMKPFTRVIHPRKNMLDFDNCKVIQIGSLRTVDEFINVNTISGEEREQLHEALSCLENKR